MVADPKRVVVVDYIACLDATAQIKAYEKVIILEWMWTAVPIKCLNFRRVKLATAVNPTVSAVDSFKERTVTIAWPHLFSKARGVQITTYENTI